MVGDLLQPTHLLFVLVVALLVLGPKRLPEVGRALGRGLRDFRSAISGEEPPEQVIPPATQEPPAPPTPQAEPPTPQAAPSTPQAEEPSDDEGLESPTQEKQPVEAVSSSSRTDSDS